ncbi:MAG: YHYH domain-containing protein [Rhizobiaceae bacterium]|nr:YHYH domain-containing protein [Rhizobiaceae bacterium]
MKSILVMSVLVLLGLSTAIAAAHGGGTNKQGCHTNHKTGGYHCH